MQKHLKSPKINRLSNTCVNSRQALNLIAQLGGIHTTREPKSCCLDHRRLLPSSALSLISDATSVAQRLYAGNVGRRDAEDVQCRSFYCMPRDANEQFTRRGHRKTARKVHVDFFSVVVVSDGSEAAAWPLLPSG